MERPLLIKAEQTSGIVMSLYENPLAARLWQKAQGLADAAGVSIAPSCEAILESFIENGVSRMAVEGVDGDEQRFQEAEDNLSKFIHQMISEANRRGVAELHEFTFGAAQTSLCPLWPFC